MTGEKLRLHFEEFGLDEYQDGWADIHLARSFGVRGRVADSSREGNATHNAVRLAEYVADWSLERPPTDRAFVESLDELLLVPLLARAEAHYEGRRRTAAERKSAGGTALPGVRDPAVAAGDGPEGGQLAS